MAWLIYAWILERAHVVIAGSNYGARWNGIGAIRDTIEKKTQAPMVYRVLMPWLVGLTRPPKVTTISTYEFYKVILTAGALWATEAAFGMQVALVTAIILPATFLYDYWDWTGEMIGIGLALTGNIYLAMGGVLVHGLSRETAPLCAAAYLLKTGDIEGAGILFFMAAIIHVVIRMIQGEHKLYCDRVMLKTNINLIRNIGMSNPAWLGSTFISIVLSVLILAGSVISGPTGLVGLGIVVSGWVLGKGDETRIFSAGLPWAAIALIKLAG